VDGEDVTKCIVEGQLFLEEKIVNETHRFGKALEEKRMTGF